MCDVMIVMITGEFVRLHTQKKTFPNMHCNSHQLPFNGFCFLKRNTERRVICDEPKDINLYFVNSENSFQLISILLMLSLVFLLHILENAYFCCPVKSSATL